MWIEASRLRDEIESQLGAPKEDWTNADRTYTRRYVELVDITKQDCPVSEAFTEDSITANGEFHFGVSVTLDNGLNTFPKSTYHISVALRFQKMKPEYTFWDTEFSATDNSYGWQGNIDIFIKDLIARLISFFEHNPLQGDAIAPYRIGFIQAG